MATAVAPAKPAPLSLGAPDRRDGTNRIELLPKPAGKPSTLVDQLLEDFARSTAKSSPVTPATAPRVTPPSLPAKPLESPAAAQEPVDAEARRAQEALRLQLSALEKRLNSLERRQDPRQEDVITRRVLAVLEQLTAELKEHLATQP